MAQMTLFALLQVDVEELSSIDELFIARSQLQSIASGYKELGMTAPDYIDVKLADIVHEIKARARVALQKRLQKAQARRKSLRTADEKRNSLDAEIANLKGQLA